MVENLESIKWYILAIIVALFGIGAILYCILLEIQKQNRWLEQDEEIENISTGLK